MHITTWQRPRWQSRCSRIDTEAANGPGLEFSVSVPTIPQVHGRHALAATHNWGGRILLSGGGASLVHYNTHPRFTSCGLVPPRPGAKRCYFFKVCLSQQGGGYSTINESEGK